MDVVILVSLCVILYVRLCYLIHGSPTGLRNRRYISLRVGTLRRGLAPLFYFFFRNKEGKGESVVDRHFHGKHILVDLLLWGKLDEKREKEPDKL